MHRSRTRRSTSRARRSLQVQPLEDRKLMAADLTATLDLGTHLFRVEGTPQNDQILVRDQAGQVSISGASINLINGTSTTRVASVDRSLIKSVEVVALAGNDTISLQELNLGATQNSKRLETPVTRIWGGDGDDTITGTNAADRIVGENGNDTITALSGNDFLEGGYGNDSLNGGAGDDNLNGNADLDALDGGAGNDSLSTGWFRDTLAGGDGIDTLVAPYTQASLSNADFRYLDRYYGLVICPLSNIEKGSLTASDSGLGYTTLDASRFSGSLSVVGSAVNDGVTGGQGADYITGGYGSDTLVGNGGDDVLYGDQGNDSLAGGYGNDSLYGGENDDFLNGNADLDLLDGGGGNDHLSTGWFRDTLLGGAGFDTLVAPVTRATLTDNSLNYWDYYYGWMNCTISGFEEASLTLHDNWGLGYTQVDASGFSGRSAMMGTAKTDYLTGGSGADSLGGMGGDDVIVGNGGDDTIYGGEGNDCVNGGSGNDQLYGEGCNDSIAGGYGNDLISGGYGDDSLSGDSGHDRIYGGSGVDTLQGGDDNDLLAGYQGNDTLWGGNGIDTLIGGQGADVLRGGAGDDTLVSIDGELADLLYGEDGADALWTDQTPGFWGPVYDSASLDSLDSVFGVCNFANGADLSLDGDSLTLQGDRIAEPRDGVNYKNFSHRPLFADLGPTRDDVQQGDLGDCWLMATLAATAQHSQRDIRQMVVDFGDGTYGVHLGNKFYRVDADLPRASASTDDLQFAEFGKQGSFWVAVVEKAYASFRFGPQNDPVNASRANSYESLVCGGAGEALQAFSLKDQSFKYFPSSTSGVDLANELYKHWKAGRITAIGVGEKVPEGARLVGMHFYSVTCVDVNASGQVTSITLRNPWGGDNAHITVSVAELGMYNIGVDSAARR